VRVHDFLIRGKGRAVPYGIYDVGENAGWLSVGIGPRHWPALRSTPFAAGGS
jgi:hypothetical protein